MLQDLLDECLDSVELRLIAGIVMSIDVQRLAVRTIQMLADPEARRRCLSAAKAGGKEQDLVDVLNALLDIDNLKPFRPVFLRGLLRFAKATGRFPRALIYNDVVIVESGTAITSGAFDDVWRGVLQGQSVAMKVMRTIKRPEEILRNYSKEAVVWSQLRHPNVLPFYGIYCWAPHDGMPLERMALLSPWLDAGNAVEYLHHHLNVDEESLILDIAQGLNYLHTFQPAIVHGDLKGNNILINSEGRACLADFGLSKLVRDEAWVTSPDDTRGFNGCKHFCAPELLFWEDDMATTVPASPPSKTTKSDVYAFGCVCYQLYTGKPRFFNLSPYARMLAVVSNKKCQKPSDMSDKLWENVEACWSTLPQDRPTMAHFVQLLAIETNAEDDPEDDSCDLSSEDLVWDGRPNPHVPLDIFQLTLGLREGST
ncbi:kinase-like domain-containing protein [Coprinopsis sp. MPI-PUGE-AT-0042]|nr:kinase-like domain-containing protein [Coprinopsis sp. MPI-PUGE-AT-0042]